MLRKTDSMRNAYNAAINVNPEAMPPAMIIIMIIIMIIVFILIRTLLLLLVVVVVVIVIIVLLIRHHHHHPEGVVHRVFCLNFCDCLHVCLSFSIFV